MMRASAFALVASTALALAIAAAARAAADGPAVVRETGVVRGRVRQPASQSHEMDHRPSTSSLGQSAHDPVDRSHAVVYIDSIARQAFETLPTTRAQMDQRRETFVPHLLAITAGTVVDFPNSDPFFHNVMSLAKGNSFDLGRYPRGRSRSVRFDNPGIVPVVCDIHSHMSAYIFVFTNSFFAITDDDGRFSIPNLPAGNYLLKVWSELGTAEPKRISVADAASVDVEFQVMER